MKTAPEDVLKAFRVCNKLQRWIEDRDDLSTVPQATLEATGDSMKISIAGIGVWNDHEDMPSELTFDYCRDAFLKEIEMFHPFLQEERRAT